MKVVCEGCQAKYKLTDGRLTGRTLKFRCRKCGNLIMIDGAESRAPLSQPPAMFDSPLADDGFGHDPASAYRAQGPDWYVSINGEPYGPSTTEQMASLLCDGQLPWDTYVWREGYAEWKAASESKTLVAAAEALIAEAPLGAIDNTGENPALAFSDWQNEAAAELAGHGGFPPDDYIPSRQPASGYGHGLRVPSAEPITGFEPEMSALLDMRALSALTGSARAATARSPSVPHPEARLSLASSRGFGGHADTLAPVDHAKRPMARALPFAILSGSALIAAAMILTVYSSSARRGRASHVTMRQVDSAPASNRPSEPQGSADTPAGAAPTGASAETASSAPLSEPSADEFIDDAVPRGDLGPTLANRAEGALPLRRADAANGPIPETPSRADVVGAMRAIEPDVRMCMQGQSIAATTASASFTVSGATGRVGNVRVSGIQGAVSECVARAVRSAMFPPFSKGQLRINFPVRLSP